MSEFKLHRNPDIEDAKIISEQPRESSSDRGRNHRGPGNRADRPALAKALADATQTTIATNTTTMNENIIKQPEIKNGTENESAVEAGMTAEKLKEERLSKIIAEIEAEWTAVHGPMMVPLSKQEIEKNRVFAQKRGQEETVSTTRMTEEASEFFFDHKGKGALSVPKRANKILEERFPEYASAPEISEVIKGGGQTKVAEESKSVAEENKSEIPVVEATTGDAQENTSANYNSWQDEAVAKFENEGGKILDAKLEERPIPVLTEVVENEEIISTTAEAQKPEPALSPEAKLNLTPEQKALVEKFENNVRQSEEALEDREVAAKIPKGKLEQVSLWYNKLPLKTKLGLSAGMIATGWVVGSAAAPALITAGVLMRTLGAGGMIYALRDRFEKSARAKNGGEITDKDARLSAASAIAISVFVSVALPNIVREYAFNPIVEKVGAIYDFYNPPAKPSVVNVAPLTPNLEYTATACPGDSRWSLVARALANGPYGEEFKKLTPSQMTYAIDALKDRLTSGMTEEVANTLNVGDKIDFKDIFGDKKFMEEAFSKAQGLTSAQLANIENYKLETPANTNIPTDAEFNKYEVSMDSTAPAIENNASTHQDTLIKTIITEGGKSVPIMEHHVPVETPSTPPTETHAVTQGNILDNVDTHKSSSPQQVSTPESSIDQLAIDNANIYVHDKVNDVFGIKFLGLITIEDGMKNADWLNFANRTVDEVYSADPHPTEAGNYQAEARRSGMGNNQAISKMQNLIYEEAKRVGVKWEKGETVDHFLHRVALIKTTIVDVPHGATIQSPEITPNIKLGFDPDINPGGN